MFLSRPSAKLFLTDMGPGPKTLLAHGGFVGSGELWAGPFGFLSHSWRAVTYDHRGSGVTTHTGRISFDQLVDDLFAVMDAASIEQCVLAGESMGAKVVLAAALKAPERVTGLVLVDGAWTKPTPDGPSSKLVAGCRADFRRTIDAFVDTCIPELDGDDARHWAKQIVYRSSGEPAAQLLEAAADIDLASRVSSIEKPTLIIHGSADRIVPLASSENLAGQMKNSKLVVMEGIGHVPTLTRPQKVASEISSFFN